MMTEDPGTHALLERIAEAEPAWIDVAPAAEVVDGLQPHDLLHAGPPLAGWQEACSALRGAVAGSLVLHGAAPDVEKALSAAQTGAWRLRSSAELGVLSTFGGVIMSSTPVIVVVDRRTGRRTFAAVNEGRGKALRYGCTQPETLERVRWLHGRFATVVGAAVRDAGGFDLLPILEQALQMGDDGHSRQKAASALLLAAIAPALAALGAPSPDVVDALAFFGVNDFFFLPLAMAAAKNAIGVDPVQGSTLVTAIAFNGARAGIRVAGIDRWFTAPVPRLHGAYFGGFGPEDAGPVIGDSEIMETFGLGAFAMAAAPSLAPYVGGTVRQAAAFTDEMYGITVGEHARLRIPALDRRGAPLGIDARKVVATGIAPIFNSGIAHRDVGVGQIGAGYGRVPLACFEAAVAAIDASGG
jgi:hypothetical protein